MVFSLKAKILATIISLSVLGLGVYGYLTFNTYKNDKLAYIYDTLSSQTQAKASLFTTTKDDNELLLASIISRIDIKTKDSSESIVNFFEGEQNKVMGLYYHIPSEPELNEYTLFEKADQKADNRWQVLKAAPMGISLGDKTKGHFIIKKNIGEEGSFVAMTFRSVDIWNSLTSSDHKHEFIINQKNVISKSNVPFGTKAIAELKVKLAESPGNAGLFESTIENEPYFVSYSRLGSNDLVLVNMIKEKTVMQVQQLLLKQMMAFLTLMVSVSLLIGTLSARWMTLQLDELTVAVKELENENFDYHVEVESKDEMGVLGNAFNNMSGKIKVLLEELRVYANELEEKVKQRTADLQRLTDIQKGMLNALGQGFVIVDKEFKVLPIYSKVAESMFEVIPNEADPGAIMGVDETQTATFKEFFDMVFMNVLGFDDMSRLAPELRSNSRNERIQLTYAPITGGEGGEPEYVLIVGTDKTAEYANMEKFKKEWNFSQMIVKIASNRFALNNIIGDSLKMLATCLEISDKRPDYSNREVQRLVHTIKGSFSYFYITEISAACHELESYLGAYYNDQKCTDDVRLVVMEKLMGIQVILEEYIDRFDNIIHFKDANTTKAVAVTDLQSFSKMLSKRSPELGELFGQQFFKSKVDPYFQIYPNLVKDLGLKLNKDVRFRMVGGNVEIPDGPWEELFSQFIHYVRNVVDHGIESVETRTERKKPAYGEVLFQFESKDSMLHITLKDDGGGVAWEKIAAKDPSVKCLADALDRIKTGGISSKDEVSDTSGRGVGMSSLFMTIDKLGGTYEFTSEAGKGTAVVIHMPLNFFKKKLELAS